MNYPICFLDTETTGVDPLTDRIVELAVIKVKEDGTREVKRTLVNPGIPIPEEASLVHWITDEMVKDQPYFRQLAKSLLSFLEGCDIAGYNIIHFDAPLLFYEFYRAGITWKHTDINLIDACTIFKRKEERNLTAAMKFFTGKDYTEAHGALSDTEAVIELLEAQLKHYPDLPKDNLLLGLYSNYDKPRYDMAGFLTKDAEGKWRFQKGKHSGSLLSSVPKPYLEWVLKSDFGADTKAIVNSFI